MSATLVRAPIQAPEIDYSRDWEKQTAGYIETLAELAREQHEGDLVGEVVRWSRADGYAQYMVLSEKPLQLVHLDLVDGYAVEDSLLRGLRLEDVREMVGWERRWKRSATEPNEAFYSSVGPGDIVHYANGFGQYVRCEVVAATRVMGMREQDTVAGVALKPIALVGQWREYDLPRYQPDGSVRMGYHAEKILAGELMQPHASTIYEYEGRAKRSGETDPRGLDPISLDPPFMTPEQERIAPLAKALEKIAAATQTITNPQDEMQYRFALTDIQDTLDAVGDFHA